VDRHSVNNLSKTEEDQLLPFRILDGAYKLQLTSTARVLGGRFYQPSLTANTNTDTNTNNGELSIRIVPWMGRADNPLD
jgi:hypothetical protein